MGGTNGRCDSDRGPHTSVRPRPRAPGRALPPAARRAARGRGVPRGRATTPGSTRFSGGFIGVDLFFVLSGYLVTQLLLRDFRSTGRIGFRRFYSRRFRRLLPAAFVTLIVTAAVYTAVAAPAEVLATRGGFRAAFLYVANWHFIAQSNDYFARRRQHATRSCTSGRSRSRSSSTSLAAAAERPVRRSRRRVGDRQWKVVAARHRSAASSRSLGAALHLSTRRTSTARTTAPTPARTSCSPARCSRSRRGVVARRGERAAAMARSSRRRPRRARRRSRRRAIHLGRDPTRRRRDDRRPAR